MVTLTVRQSGTAVTNKVYIGTTHSAIQTAVNYANTQGGGTIFIEKGTYDIQVPINLYSNIKVHGEYFGTKLVPSFANSGTNAVFNCVGTSGNELENIIVSSLLIGGISSKVGMHGIYCSYVGKAPTAGKSGGGYDSTTVGINVINKKGITVKDCIIQNNSRDSINLQSSSNNTITGNTCQNNSDGISLYLSSNNTITGNTCQNNNMGISLYSSSNNTITGNTCQNNNNMGIYIWLESNNNTVTGNTYQNNSSYGIYLSSSSNNNTVTGNTCQNNSFYGIYLESSSNNTVTGNTCQNNNMGISLYSSSNNTITGNTCQNNNNMGIYIWLESNNNTVTGNTYQNNSSYGISLISSSNNTVTGNKYTSINIDGSSTGNLNAATHNQTTT